MVIRFTDWLLKMLIFDVRCLCLQSVTDKMSKSLVCFRLEYIIRKHPAVLKYWDTYNH